MQTLKETSKKEFLACGSLCIYCSEILQFAEDFYGRAEKVNIMEIKGKKKAKSLALLKYIYILWSERKQRKGKFQERERERGVRARRRLTFTTN